MAKAPTYKPGDIVIQEQKGWKRLIVAVIENYQGVKGRYGYRYKTEAIDDNYQVIEGEWAFWPYVCGEAHLKTWAKR